MSESLFLAPHNDDETLFGAYTLLREQPHVVVCLQSVRMSKPDYPGNPEHAVDWKTRVDETSDALHVFGIDSWTQWSVPDDAPDWDTIAEQMAKWDDMKRVFAPAVELGGHEQHNVIGELAVETFGRERVTPYLTYTNGTTRSTNGIAVDYQPGWPELKRKALDCYRSQIAHPMTGHHFSAPLDEFYAAL